MTDQLPETSVVYPIRMCSRMNSRSSMSFSGPQFRCANQSRMISVSIGHFGAGIDDLGNTVGGRLGHTGGAFGREDQHALIRGERVEAVLGTVLGVVQTGDRGL